MGFVLFLCWNIATLNAQTPTLTNATPLEGFAGEQVCFPVTFVNTGAIGYGVCKVNYSSLGLRLIVQHLVEQLKRYRI